MEQARGASQLPTFQYHLWIRKYFMQQRPLSKTVVRTLCVRPGGPLGRIVEGIRNLPTVLLIKIWKW